MQFRPEQMQYELNFHYSFLGLLVQKRFLILDPSPTITHSHAKHFTPSSEIKLFHYTQQNSFCAKFFKTKAQWFEAYVQHGLQNIFKIYFFHLYFLCCYSTEAQLVF